MKDYSVLMSVYQKEHAEWLRQSMDSMFRQTVPPSDFVLVCDGPLTEELEAVIGDMLHEHGELLQVIRLARNRGLGNALKTGVPYCRCDIIARMDSDDVSRPDRCEKQLKILEQYPDVGIVSGTIEEFREFRAEETEINGRRVLPETADDILRYSRLRCPFNHPCVMFRKQAVLDAGSYSDEDYPEDYYLWVRMLMNGTKGYNIQEPLLWMRSGDELYRRRAGRDYLRKHLHLFRYMHDNGFISTPQYLWCSAARTAGALMPNGMRAKLYSGILHRRG